MASVAVVFQLLALVAIPRRYMDVPPISAAAKVRLGGGPVLATGIGTGQAG